MRGFLGYRFCDTPSCGQFAHFEENGVDACYPHRTKTMRVLSAEERKPTKKWVDRGVEVENSEIHIGGPSDGDPE